MTTWFTSDPHYGHANIIKYCNRPYKDVEQMNEALLDEYNRLVSPEDTVYFLGDIVFSRKGANNSDYKTLLEALNGKKHLVLGNHDKMAGLGRYFISCQKYLEIKVPYTILGEPADCGEGIGSNHESPIGGGARKREAENSSTSLEQFIVLCHYPFVTWNKSHYGSWNLHGHCHGTLPDDPSALRLDVGVDCHSYRPISFDQVAEIMAAKTFQSIDHHGM